MKKTIILAIAIMLGIGAFARENSFRDRSDNWLQNEEETTSGSLRGAIDDSGETPSGALSVPVGALPLAGIILCGSLYGICRRKKGNNPTI